MVVVVGVTTIADGRATQSAALLGGLSAAGATVSRRRRPRHDAPGPPRLAIFSASLVGFSLVLAVFNSTSHRTSNGPRQTCGPGRGFARRDDAADASPRTPATNPAGRFAATASAHDVSVAVDALVQRQAAHPRRCPEGATSPSSIDDPAFNTDVRMQDEDVADQPSAAGVIGSWRRRART